MKLKEKNNNTTKSKKIGIITFHRAENFGATLQLLSLQEKLVSLGFDVSIIDYRNKNIEKVYSLFDISSFLKEKKIIYKIKYLLLKILILSLALKKKRNYKIFWKSYIRTTKRKHTKVNIPSDYDFYICGSDQIWNPILTAGIDPVYFLDFNVRKGNVKIAYAASTEEKSLPYYEKYATNLKSLLERLDFVSVREKNIEDIFRKITDRKITTVVDPTFLHDKKFYFNFMKKPDESNYILIYHLEHSPESVALAETFSKRYSKKIIEIHAIIRPFRNHRRHKQGIGVSEILGYINYADCIITTSYHGMVLSIILKKDFYVINQGSNIRHRDLLSKLDMDDRIIYNINDIDTIKKINYAKIKPILKSEIENSEKYLLTSLGINKY